MGDSITAGTWQLEISTLFLVVKLFKLSLLTLWNNPGAEILKNFVNLKDLYEITLELKFLRKYWWMSTTFIYFPFVYIFMMYVVVRIASGFLWGCSRVNETWLVHQHSRRKKHLCPMRIFFHFQEALQGSSARSDLYNIQKQTLECLTRSDPLKVLISDSFLLVKNNKRQNIKRQSLSFLQMNSHRGRLSTLLYAPFHFDLTFSYFKAQFI